MNFSEALEALKQNKKVSRAGWNGKNMWLRLIDGSEYNVSDEEISGSYVHLGFIGMKTADNCFVPWLASQTDILAEDWGVVQ